MALKTIYAPGLSGKGTRDKALAQVGRAFSPGWCLYWCLTQVFKVPGLGDYDHDGDADAVDYWKAAVKRGKVVKTSDPKKIPAGVLISWTGGANGYGHAAYSLGNGMMVSTDLPTRGRIGKVSIDTARKQWGLTLVGYVLVDGNGFTLTRDAVDERRWCKIGLVNHAAATPAMEKDGAVAKWEKRRAGLVNITLQDVKPDVLVGLECGAGDVWKYLTKKYRDNGYALVPGGKEGRHIWRKKETVGVPVASDAISLPAKLRHDGNDLPSPWMVSDLDGTRGLVIGSHLDWRSTDQQRVDAALYIIAQAVKIAQQYDVGLSRIIFAADTGSENWVRDRAFETQGWADAFDVAAEVHNKDIKSKNDWKPARKGPRVDGIFVYNRKGSERPVLVANQRITDDTDHQYQAVIVGRQED